METKEATPVPQVYTSISAVMAYMSREGIAKGRKNQQQGYAFRGIDDVYNALSGALSAARLLMLPRVLSRTVTERETKNGGVLFYVVMEVEFDLIAAVDGSKHTIRVVGEAMDSADKASNKAMSAAYKYAAMQAFCIPVEGQDDADATTPEPAPRRETPAAKAARQAAHDPSWTGDRAAFCARLGELGVEYEDVAAWCEAIHRPRPSAMSRDMRGKLLAHIEGAGRSSLDSFIQSTTKGK